LQAVCDRALQHWNSLNLFFTKAALEDKLATAKTILNALRNPIFKLYLEFLSFTLDSINTCNKEFQSEDSKIPILLDRIRFLYKRLFKCFVKKEVLDNSHCLQSIKILNPHIDVNIENLYLGGKVDNF
jgi:hypothetical protein